MSKKRKDAETTDLSTTESRKRRNAATDIKPDDAVKTSKPTAPASSEAKRATRPSRLGRGLSSLMAAPVAVPVPAAEAEPAQVPVAEAQDLAIASPPVKADPEVAAQHPPQARDADVQDDSPYRYLAPDQLIRNASQPRQHFDPTALSRLSHSIREHGVMQPIVARPAPPGAGAPDRADTPRFEIIAGERRWRAAQEAGLDAVPVIVQEVGDQQAAEWALIENLQREDLNPIERANAFQRLGEEFQLPHERIAERVGLERSTITNHLRLLNLNGEVQRLIADDLLAMGHARALAGLASTDQQLEIAQRCVREAWSVRQTEAAVRRAKDNATDTPGSSTKRAPAVKAAWIADLERQIAEALGTKVQIKPGKKKNSGTLAIDYFSVSDFDRLLERLQIQTE